MPVRLPPRLMTRLLVPSALVVIGALAGCSSDEAAAPETHTPASAKLFVAGVDVTANLVLQPGVTTRVEVRFYHDDGDLITGIEDHHYAGLVFTAPSLATAVGVVDQHFFVDVTAQAASGAGTVMVGYGHDIDADELTFGPFPVTIP